MEKYAEIIKLLERIFGKGTVARSIGTRTNVTRFPKGPQGIDPTTRHYDVRAAAMKNPDLVNTIKNSVEDRMGDLTKMNDQELLTYKQNLQRLDDILNPPSADVVAAGSKQQVTGEGLEKLIDEQGLKNPPTTNAGQLESTSKRLQKLKEDFYKEFDVENIAKQEADRQAIIAKQYEGKGFEGGVFGPSQYYRPIAKEFLLDQAEKGKIKLNPSTIENFKNGNYISGGQPLMYEDPIRVLRHHYGDDIFTKIPLDELKKGSGNRKEILNAMSRIDIKPVKINPPTGAGGYMTPGELEALIEENKNIEKMIKNKEYRFANMTDEEIANELNQYGSKRSSFEQVYEMEHPEEFKKYKNQKKPEQEFGINKPAKVSDFKAETTKRTSVDNLIDEYNANQDRLSLTDEEGGTAISYDEFNQLRDRNREIAKALEDKGISSKIEEETKPEGIVIPFKKKNLEPEEKADGGSIGLDYLMGMDNRQNYASGGDVKKILDLIAKANKELKGKKSMKGVNPKTGEITSPKNPIMTVEDLQFKHKDAFNAHDQIKVDIGDKIAPDMIAESMAEMKGKDYFDLPQKEQSDLYKKALAYVDDVRMTKRQNKSLYVRGDAITEENFGNTPFAPSQETLDNLKKAKEMTKGMSLHDEMNMVLNQYDKSMFIKNEQGMVDVADPENVRKMALLLKRDHPELYRRLEMEIQPNILEDFDVTGREPNKDGGLNHLLGF